MHANIDAVLNNHNNHNNNVYCCEIFNTFSVSFVIFVSLKKKITKGLSMPEDE